MFAGLLVAYLADTSLDKFVKANQQQEADGKPKRPLLATGRHDC